MSYHMPAVCDNCGTIFDSKFAFNGEIIALQLEGNKVGPCPTCGQIGHIPDGLYNFVDNVLEVLSAPDRTIEELNRLSEILHAADKNNSTPEQVKTQIETEHHELHSLIDDLLPKTREEKREDFKFWVKTTLQILGMIISLHHSHATEQVKTVPVPKIEVNQVIDNIAHQNETKSFKTVMKIGRNDLCPCGSGKKYKYCHLELV